MIQLVPKQSFGMHQRYRVTTTKIHHLTMGTDTNSDILGFGQVGEVDPIL